LSCDVTRSFRIHDIKAMCEIFSVFYDFSVMEWNFQAQCFALCSKKILRAFYNKISTKHNPPLNHRLTTVKMTNTCLKKTRS